MAGQPRENVAIFNPLVLPLPNWHPDGPDGMVDGFVVPFVFPESRESGRQPNRGSKIRVYPTDHGWRAALISCQDHAETAAQARAFAAAWIRAAEVLENVAKTADVPQRQLLGADQDAGVSTVVGKPPRLPGEPKSPLLAETDPPAALHPDDEPQAACGVCGNVGRHHPKCPTRLGEAQ